MNDKTYMPNQNMKIKKKILIMPNVGKDAEQEKVE
jgi:hypothetical protein